VESRRLVLARIFEMDSLVLKMLVVLVEAENKTVNGVGSAESE
jgi:hypothetical protein